MFRNFGLTFPEGEANRVRSAYAEASLIVEYGSGGSTFLAAEQGKTILAVESSEKWLLELMASVQERSLPGRVIPMWANIGRTGEWGYPVDNERATHWMDYPLLPWRFADEHGLAPDTVMIDGRFRVACFLATATAITAPVTILFDDYGERTRYHVVSEVCEPSEMIGRLAVFHLEPGAVSANLLLRNLPVFMEAF